MPQYPNYPSDSTTTTTAHVVDLHTAVKHGLLDHTTTATLPFHNTTTTTTNKPTTTTNKPTTTAAAALDLKHMIEHLQNRDDDLDIPKVFICPISLDPMTDPVTLCTGHTYDRPNISTWLSLGHATCPTTMQDLWDLALTPNTTLLHLSLEWFAHRYHMSVSASPSPPELHSLLRSLHHAKGHAKVPVLRQMRRLPADALSDAGLARALCSLLGPLTSHAVGSEAIALLVTLSLDHESLSSLTHPARVSLVVDMLNEGSLETKLDCVSFLELLMDGNADFKSRIAESLSLLVGLLRMVRDRRNPTGVWPGIRLLRVMCSDERVRGALIGVGGVTHIVDSIPDLPHECLEAALHVLELLSSTHDGKVAIKGCEKAIPNLVRVLMRVSEACTGKALAVLWAVCELDPDGCAAAAVEAGLAARLLLVMQSACGAPLKQRAAELLKVCRLNYSDSRFISKCRLTKTIQ